MDSKDIQQAVIDLNNLLIERGFLTPSCEFHIDDLGFQVGVMATTVAGESCHRPSGVCKFTVSHDTPEASFKDAREIIDELKTPDDVKREKMAKCIAEAIEIGRDLGEDAEFLNPLEATMKRLSSNIIAAE